MSSFYRVPEEVKEEIKKFRLTEDEQNILIDEFVKNNIYGKTTKESGDFTGFFKTVTKKSNFVIGEITKPDGFIDLTDYEFALLKINDGWWEPCFVKTLMYQSAFRDRDDIHLCEGDIFYYKKQFRYVVAYRNGSTVDFRFKKIRSEDNNNPMYLSDLNSWKIRNKIIRVGNIFDPFIVERG